MIKLCVQILYLEIWKFQKELIIKIYRFCELISYNNKKSIIIKIKKVYNKNNSVINVIIGK